MTDTMKGITAVLGRESVKTDLEVLEAYSVDQVVPRAVVFPRDTRQVSDIVRFASQERLAVVPWMRA